MRDTILILKKELKRIFDDRKMILSLFVTPAITMVLVCGFIGVLTIVMVTKTVGHTCTAQYAGDMPDTMARHLAQSGVQMTPIERIDAEAARQAVAEERVDLFVDFGPDPQGRIADGQKPGFTVYYDPSVEGSEKTFSLFEEAAAAYQNEILAGRLGGAERLEAFSLTQVSFENTRKSVGGIFGSIVVMVLVIFIFSSSMQQGIDSIAGEKERGVFATLLMTPVNRMSISAGKTFSLTLVSILSAVSIFIGTVLGLVGVLTFVALRYDGVTQALSELSQGAVGLGILSFGTLLMLLVQMILIGVFSASAVCFVSSLAKTVKEASSYITPLYLIVMLVCYIPVITGSGAPESLPIYLIPLYGNISAVISLISGSLTAMQTLFSALSTVLLAVGLTLLSSRLYQTEKYIF